MSPVMILVLLGAILLFWSAFAGGTPLSHLASVLNSPGPSTPSNRKK